jgi:small subunit ribosomal protein S17
MNSAIEQRNGRTLVGTVVSDKCDKTIVVLVETLVQHPLLKKYVRRHKKFNCPRSSMNECGIGDKVKIVEYRPMSRNKRWHLVSVLEKASSPHRATKRKHP